MSDWSCSVCTYDNIYARSICEMCEAPRPDSSPAAAAAPSAAPARAPVASSSSIAPSASPASSAAVKPVAPAPAKPAPVLIKTEAALLAEKVAEEHAKALRAKAREAALAAAEEAKAAKEKEEHRRRVAAAQRDAAAHAQRSARVNEAAQREEAMATAFTDIDAALDSVSREYDGPRLQLLCATLLRVVRPILAAPEAPERQRVQRRHDAVKRALIRTQGGQSLLRIMGFYPSHDGTAFELRAPPRLDVLRAVEAAVVKRQALSRSPVSEHWPRSVEPDAPLGSPADGPLVNAAAAASGGVAMGDGSDDDDDDDDEESGKGKHSGLTITAADAPFIPTLPSLLSALRVNAVTAQGTAEEQCFTAAALWKVLSNALVASERDRDLRCVDTAGETYRRHLRRHPYVGDILSALGYEPSGEGGVFLEVAHVDRALFEAACAELAGVVRRLKTVTPLGKLLRFILTQQQTAEGRAEARKVVEVVRKAVVGNLMGVPLEPKYHRVNIGKLLAVARRAYLEEKQGGGHVSWDADGSEAPPLKGIVSLFRALGFVISPDGKQAATPYGLGVQNGKGVMAAFDVGMLEFRAEEIDKALAAAEDSWDI